MPSERIHLDFNASTPIAPEAAEAMRPFLALLRPFSRGVA